MKSWIVFAIISMVFAGFTSVIAKMGMNGVSGELGLAVRTIYVFVFVLVITMVSVPLRQWSLLNRSNYAWLGLSGATTTLSWLFYYKALKDGEVSTIALIDKGSIFVAIVLAALIFKEQITWRTIAGGCLIISGILIVARK